MSFMLSVANKPFMQSVVMLNVVMLSVVMLNAVASGSPPQRSCSQHAQREQTCTASTLHAPVACTIKVLRL